MDGLPVNRPRCAHTQGQDCRDRTQHLLFEKVTANRPTLRWTPRFLFLVQRMLQTYWLRDRVSEVWGLLTNRIAAFPDIPWQPPPPGGLVSEFFVF